jgi:group II intron reverse transcriptase/maturase
VSVNRGAGGVDGVEIGSIEAEGVTGLLDGLAAELKAGTYRPAPLRRVWIPKAAPGEFRPLSIPTVRDRVVMAAAKIVLEPVFEADFLPASHGFRPHRSAHDANETIRVEVNRGRRWVLDADVRDCFGSIDHDALMGLVEARVSDRAMLRLLRSWLRAGVLDTDGHHPTEAGTPQGSPISPLLANIALHTLDAVFEGRRTELGILVRFADDFVVLASSRRQAEAARQRTVTVLTDLGLTLHPDKTGIVNLYRGQDGFDFLGFHHRMRESPRKPGRYYLNRWPSTKSTARIRQRIRELTARNYAGAPTEWVVERLNLVLRGWGNYFRWGNSNRTFHGIDSYVHWRLAKLAQVKHGQRGRGWASRHNHAWITRLGVHQLTGTVRYQTTHATR